MSQKKLEASDYVHLHNHTQYSLLDGLTKVPDLINYVKDKAMKAVAMTDHGTLSGAIEFYKEAKSNGVKPIIGMETYIAARNLTDKEPGKDKVYYHLILLAKNNVGYRNLIQLSTIANLEGFYYKPRIDRQTLKKYSEGLIALSGCIGSELGDALRNSNYEGAKKVASWYKEVFGDNYYLEVQDHGHPDHPSHWTEQAEVNKLTFELADELNIKCALTCDAHYLKLSDQEAHEILLCVQTGSFLSDEKRMSLKDFHLNVTDPSELISRWGDDRPDIIKNTRLIADSCEVDIELGKILIPKYDVPKGQTEKTYLEKLVYEGLGQRYNGLSIEQAEKLSINELKKKLPKDVLARSEFELGVIEQMGFNGYFLIIQDFINWGKSNGIVFGPGRGSAAGSIIAYSLKITELDPLEYDLLFERFLNPDRISMPDIDIDIQDSRRGEVIEYCVDKYGENRVANIVTFGRMAARNAVRDVSRVLQVPYAEADRLAKMIPPPVQGRHIPLDKSLVDDQDLKKEYETNQQSKRIFDLATQLDGTIRSHGVHAAGVVIAPDDITQFVPLEMAQKGVVATQYSMGPIEELGLLKMDFLGLSNLTVINNALRIIKKVYKKDIDINALPLDDKKTYELLQRGETVGVFQFESSGMKRYLKELKPTVFDDIVAMGALYRPGPLTAGLTQRFINRKNGLEEISYDHESMKSALGSTYGVLVYQEQVMRIAQDMCGFTGGEADTLRKAIGKKKRDVMAKMKEQFIEGATTTSGVPRAYAEKFWKDLEGFADYAFNKSHSACYGLISYQTAYLKANFPDAFMAALMTSDFNDTDRLAIEIKECEHLGIKVLPPDINESFIEFAVVPNKNQIRFGLAAIKNVGAGAVEDILKARDDGSFVSIEDFFNRVSSRIVNKKIVDSLIKSGAFDELAERPLLINNIDLLIAFSNKQSKLNSSDQIGLFGDKISEPSISLQLIEPETKVAVTDQLLWERELLGVFLSQHPLNSFNAILEEQTIPINEIKHEFENKKVSVGGSVIDIKEVTTKNGQKMAFARIADKFGEVELIVFPGNYQSTELIWVRDKVIIAKGKVNTKDRDGNTGQDIKIMVDEAQEITLAQAESYQKTGKKIKPPKNASDKKTPPMKAETSSQENDIKRLYIRVSDGENNQLLTSIKKIIDSHPGEGQVVLVIGANKQAIKLPSQVEFGDAITDELSAVVGSDNIKIT